MLDVWSDPKASGLVCATVVVEGRRSGLMRTAASDAMVRRDTSANG
jgi:hypothetical protein